MGLKDPVAPRLHGLDHLRALAILLVFLFHYQVLSPEAPAWFGEWVQFGWTGVDLFFVLSGFLIASQLFSELRVGKQLSLKVFFAKRFFRIIPVFLVVLAIYFCVPAFREKEALPPLWRFLTFTQNFGLNLFETGTFSHAWSLCVEEHFYLLLPLTLLAFRFRKAFRYAWIVLVVLFIGGFVIRHFSWEMYFAQISRPHARVLWYELVYYPTYNRLDGLLIGVGIAAWTNFAPQAWNRISRFGNYWIALSLAVLVASYYLCYDQASYAASVFGFPLVAVGYGLLVIGAISPNSFLYRWKSGITMQIATLSYALYLSHKGIIHLAQGWFFQLGVAPNGTTMLVSCLLLCLLAAWILNRIVERPFLRWRKQWLNKTSALPKTTNFINAAYAPDNEKSHG